MKVSIKNNRRWEKVDVVFRLKTPLHIGYLPFTGSVVSQTRYYVPGRNLWGAVTKKITESLFAFPDPEDYKKTGKQVMNVFRFSYFYLYDGETIYLPHYTGEGLKYGNNKGKISKSEFEHRFIGSRISTSIDMSTGTAKDESLHEIEFINNKFKDKNSELKNVRTAGCIWVKDISKIEQKKIIINNKGIFVDGFNIIQELILGGESKYGFGHVVLDSVDTVNFPIEAIETKKGEISFKIKGRSLPAHFEYNKDIAFNGDIELVAGRGYYDPKRQEKNSKKPGQIVSKPKYYFSPGTIIKNDIKAIINRDGTLSKNPQTD